ncbi:MAG: VOC family protein [Roseibium sp.]|uniref:VOC family protein n=1 Tax=Roseibium sp. TaxID=1936156 RepID=UPI0026177D0E|nr:VOC family protein [Roseibium sp.]MCV0428046.1 VOC family protein [Roseibium sp.]
MKFKHVSIVARNADDLSRFYKTVFGCWDLRLPRKLSGEKIYRGNGLQGVDIYSVWLSMPGVEGPFLELLQYDQIHERLLPKVNEPGYGHLSFEVADIQSAIASILEAGGQQLGEITNFGTTSIPVLLIYMRDPEGNILELEQSSDNDFVRS